jgi:spermidine/putrescine transport system substrate-binding protein
MNTRRTTTPKSVQASRLNRRDFLIRGGLMGAGALSLPALLAACGSDSGSTADTVGGGGDSSLFFENWPGYMDEETIGLFQAASGVSLK